MFKFAAVFALLVVSATALPSRRQNEYKSPMPRFPPRAGAEAPTRPDGRIIEGSVASEGQFPHQAALVIDRLYFCGGSLIDVDWVVSAGHCTTGANSVVVTLGVVNKATGSATEQEIASDLIITNENYGPLRAANDIGLVKLSSSANVGGSSNVAVIPLATSGPDVGETTTISGWGKTSDATSSTSDELMWKTIGILDYSECSSYYGFGDSALQICLEGQAACNGDSGGPMTNSDGSLLYGVTSYGSSAGCESNAPNVYTRISGYNDWITSTLANN